MRHARERGFSLIEAVIAMSVLAAGTLSVAQLSIASARANAVAQESGVAQRAAREKLEQLQALAWTSDAAVLPVTDRSSDVSWTPPRASGGSGLGASPSDTLLSNVSGYCDFLDANGQWMAAGVRAPSGAAWVRRWSIQPFDSLADTLILQVLVVSARASDARQAVAAAAAINGAWLVDLRTRTAR
jgi:type II secretory pathway pseudopilin PulG